MPCSAEACEVNVDKAVEDSRRRECYGRALVCVPYSRTVPAFHTLLEVLQTVAAQSGVALKREPREWAPACRHLSTETVRVLDVACERLADVALLAGHYELVDVLHVVEVDTCEPVLALILIAPLQVEQTLRRRIAVANVVGEVVALGLAVGVSDRSVSLVSVGVVADASLRVHEEVVLVDVDALVLVVAVGALLEVVVESVGVIVDIAHLHVEEPVPAVAELAVSLEEPAPVVLVGVRVVVLVSAVGEVFLLKSLVSDVRHLAPVVATEELHAEAAHYVPQSVLVVDVVESAVVVLRKALLAYSVRLYGLQLAILLVHLVDAELRSQLCVLLELGVVAVAVCVVSRYGVAPAHVGRLPGEVKDVVALLEVVGSLLPVRSVAHLVAFCGERLCRIGSPVVVHRYYKFLVERVELAQSVLPHILIAVDSPRLEVGIAVVVARRNAVPRLTRVLEVADVLIRQLEAVAEPSQSAVVRARASACAVDVSIGVGLVISAVDDEVVGKQTCREVASDAICVERAVRTRHLHGRLKRRSGCSERHRTAEGSVAVGRRAHATLYLRTAHKSCVAVHVSPEHALVFGRVERHTVYRDVDAAAGSATHTHIDGAGANAVLAPREHTRCAGEEPRQLLA